MADRKWAYDECQELMSAIISSNNGFDMANRLYGLAAKLGREGADPNKRDAVLRRKAWAIMVKATPWEPPILWINAATETPTFGELWLLRQAARFVAAETAEDKIDPVYIARILGRTEAWTTQMLGKANPTRHGTNNLGLV